MDAPQWPQEVATLPKAMEEITPQNNNSRISTPLQQQQQQQSLERRTRPLKDQTINCPRCNSTNTKFCYYNNYSLTQPRYFCKTCRRYWTQGGTLRSVPVGGGSRKNKRSSSSNPSLTPPLLSTTTSPPPPLDNKLIIPDLNPPTSLSHLLNNTSSQNPNIKFLQGHDLNLAFPIQGLFHHHQFPKIEGNHHNNNNENHEQQQQQININSNNNNNKSTNNSICPTTTTTTTTTSTQFSALDLLRTEIASRGNLNPFLPISVSDPNTLYQSGYLNLHEFKPSMNFFSPPSDHNNNNNNNNNNMVGPNNNNNNVGGGARLLFPFADMNKLANNNNNQQQHHEDHIHDHNDDQSNGNENDHHNHHGYWGGMLDNGGTW